MKSPDRYISLPLYVGEGHWANSSKVWLIWDPKVTTLDMDNLFGGRSLFILDFIATADDGHFDKPLYMIILVKTGVQSTPVGWMCEYSVGAKVILLDAGETNKKIRPKTKRPEPAIYAPNLGNFSDFEDIDFDEHPDCA